MTRKKLIAICMVCVMALGFSPSAAMVAFAETGDTTADPDYYSVFIGTDRHEDTESLQNTAKAAQNYVSDTFGTDISSTLHGGDLMKKTNSGCISDTNEDFTEVLTSIDQDGNDCYYTYGHKHDSNVEADGPHKFLDSAGVSVSEHADGTMDTGACDLDGAAWIWGIDHFEMTNTDYAASASAAFTEWVEETAAYDDKPIIVMSHVPMHDRRGDNYGAQYWLDAINAAAETNDILFFWGHNHTGWNAVDQAASYVAPGGSITPYGGSSTEINFTYALAGYLSEDAENAWNGTTVTVSENTIYLDEYSTTEHANEYTIDRMHNWSFTDFSWTGSSAAGYTAAANYICANCGKTNTVAAEITAKVTAATGAKSGKINYTATSAEDCVKHTESKTAVTAPTMLRAKVKNKKMILTWTKVAQADGYYVYYSKCGKALKKAKTTKAGTQKATIKKLKKTNYKAVVKAYKVIGGKKVIISKSYMTYITLKSGRKANARKVTLKSAADLSLTKGETAKVKAAVKTKAGKKLFYSGYCKKLRYATTNTAVAKVTSAGKITAVGTGKCKVYAISPNGIRKAVTVTVK